MALIGTIRKNSWLLFIMIGVALAGFLIMDMVGQSSQFSVGNMTLGKIDGEEIDYREFMAHEEAVYSGGGSDMFTRRDFLWNYYLNKALFDKEADANGVQVGKEELLALQFGNNLSPVIQQRFMNPQTGSLDFQQLNEIRQQIESGMMPEETRRFWAWQEKEVIADRKQAKVTNLVAQSFYTPGWMVDRLMEDQKGSVNMAFVKIPFDKAQSGNDPVSEKQILDFMKKHKGEFYNKNEQRVLEYLTVDVELTAQDSSEVWERMREVRQAFARTDNDTTFVQSHDGEFVAAYQYKENLSGVIADSAFSEPIGSLIGPYERGNQLAVSKIINRKVIPDSVRSRHILFQAQDQQQLFEGFQKADSIKQIIESGELSFDSLARAHGQDASAPQGGELGYSARGQMVPEFDDHIFFQAEEGELHVVVTQFGVHLVEVTGKKFITNKEGVQLATVSEMYEPSQRTQDSLYDIAQELISGARSLSDLRENIAGRPEFRLRKADPIEENGFRFANFGGGNVSRDIIRWAFNSGTKEGDLSSVVYIYQNPEHFYNDTYVIVGLDQINPAGYPDPESVRLNVEQRIVDRIRGEKIAQQISGTSLKDIANEYGVSVDTAFNVTFGADAIQGIGDEPKVVAAIHNTSLNKMTSPIVGTTGVFIAQPFSRQESGGPDYATVRNNSVSYMVDQIGIALIESLKEEAEIQDNRSEFF